MHLCRRTQVLSFIEKRPYLTYNQSMLIIIVFFGILPFFMGMLLGTKQSVAETYLKGSLITFGVFSLCYYVVLLILRDTSMVTLGRWYQVTMIPLLILGGIRWFRGRVGYRKRLQDVVELFRRPTIWMCFALVLALFHVVRVGWFQPFALSDSQTYDALIHDMAQTGVIYGQAPRTGQILSSLSEVDPRYIITSWYVYEAYIARITGVHALIVTETVIPMFILLLSYLALWMLSECFFGGDMDRRWGFLFLCGVLSEAQLVFQDAAAYMLIWPAWGKNLVSSIICPLIAALFLRLVLQESGAVETTFLLALCSFVAANASAASMMAIPVELGALCLVFGIAKRRIGLFVVSGIAIVPIGVQFVLYKLFVSHLLF